MTKPTPLAQVVNSWELPLAIENEAASIDAVADLGTARGLGPEDYALILEEATEHWQTTGVANAQLRNAVNQALQFTPRVLDSVDAKAYFEMYDRLREGGGDVASLSHSVSRRLLSRASLVAHLLGEERFSCSQVARLLAYTEASLDVPHGAISVIARKLGLLPALNRNSVGQDLWDSDHHLSLELFPDSTVEETNDIAGEASRAWLPEADVELLLQKLCRSDQVDQEPFWPYLQMLHWCLTPIEYFDHPASYLYEFAPRGQVGTGLFARYPTVTGNPVLNNAKAVQTLNSTWARNRGGADAHALVALLGTIESLPFVPRRQVARVLRAWLIRMIELRTVEPVLIDCESSEALFTTITNYVASRETFTQGVIEQRVVDALAVLAFDEPGWRARGLGDGVNASNLSRHKLGDVEFTNVNDRYAIALEAHGGHLSATYVRDHARSLARIIEQRLSESWLSIDDPDRWIVEVLFVAHSRDTSNLPLSETLHGVNVVYNYIDYAELIRRARGHSTAEERMGVLDCHIIDKLNEATVRESTREKFRKIAELQFST